MANGNPFYVAPLGGQAGNIVQGLTGLGGVLKEKREGEAAQQRKQQMFQDFQGLQGSQNYEDYAKFSVQYPEFAQQAKDAFGFTNKQTEDAATETYTDILTATSEEGALRALEAGMDKVTALGGTPTNMEEDYNELLSGEEGALDRIRQGALMAKPELLSAWKAMQETGADKKTEFSNIKDLRKAAKDADPDYLKIEDSYGRVQASSQDPSAAGDLALIFNYMKMLDPGSTVREGEFATAQNAAGVDQRILSAYNRVISGQRLTEDQRSDFFDRSGKLFGKAKDLNKKRTSKIRKHAKELGLDESLIFSEQIDVSPMPAPQAAEDALRANPTPEMTQFFQEKYGYVPEGI